MQPVLTRPCPPQRPDLTRPVQPAYLSHFGELADHLDARDDASLQGTAPLRLAQQVHLVDHHQGNLNTVTAAGCAGGISAKIHY